MVIRRLSANYIKTDSTESEDVMGGGGSGQGEIGEDCGQGRTAAAGSAGDDAPIWGRNRRDRDRIDGESMENRWRIDGI